jgi:hypothetical protein
VSSNEVVALIGDIAWPLTVLLILIVLRHEVRAIFHVLQKRIADLHTPVKLTREGLELSSRVEVLEGVIETQQLKTDVLASATVTAQQSRKLLNGSRRLCLPFDTSILPLMKSLIVSIVYKDGMKWHVRWVLKY